MIRSDAESAAQDQTGAWLWVGSTLLLCFVFGLVFAWGTFALGRDRYAAPVGPLEVRQISVAFDWTRRAELQAQLAALAQSNHEGMAGRHAASEATARLLCESAGAARYAAFATFRLSEKDAEAKFQSLAQSLRARYRHELAGSRAFAHAPTQHARADEGEGLVVVSMVVAWSAHMSPLPTTLDPAAVELAFKTVRPAQNTQVVALEVIWSPAAELDRMSSAELEMLYPELVRLDGDPTLGRVSCGYCRAVYPAEIGRCPTCGAPRG